MEIKVTTTPSIDSIISRFKGFEEILVTKLKEGVLGYSYLVERGAKIFSPVDTGRLRSSIGVSLEVGGGGLSSFIQPSGAALGYAYYVHEGTRYMKGRPFMEWGLNAYRRAGDALMIKKINEALATLETKL